MLAPAFLILGQPYNQETIQKSKMLLEEEDVAKSTLMASAPTSIFKEMEVKDLGHFTAYTNKAIKAAFNDRTIVRIMKDCRIIRVLNRKGDELLFNLDHPSGAIDAYKEYIKVA